MALAFYLWNFFEVQVETQWPCLLPGGTTNLRQLQVQCSSEFQTSQEACFWTENPPGGQLVL